MTILMFMIHNVNCYRRKMSFTFHKLIILFPSNCFDAEIGHRTRFLFLSLRSYFFFSDTGDCENSECYLLHISVTNVEKSHRNQKNLGKMKIIVQIPNKLYWKVYKIYYLALRRIHFTNVKNFKNIYNKIIVTAILSQLSKHWF